MYISSAARARARSHVRVLEQGFFGLSWRLRAVRVAVAAAVLPPAAGAQAQVGVLRDEQGHQQSQQHRAGSEEEGRAGDDGVLGERAMSLSPADRLLTFANSRPPPTRSPRSPQQESQLGKAFLSGGPGDSRAQGAASAE